MNYTTGEPINLHSECVCESPRGSIPVKNAPPALPTQLTYLTEKVGCLADSVNRLSMFITDTTIEPDRIDDKSVSANIAYCVRMLDAMCGKLDYINEFCR